MDNANDIRGILSANIRRLMTTKFNEAQLAKKAKISQSSVNRILNKEVGATADKIAAIAEALKVDAWELMLPVHPSAWDPQTLQWSSWFHRLNQDERKKLSILAMLMRDGAPEGEILKLMPQLEEEETSKATK